MNSSRALPARSLKASLIALLAATLMAAGCEAPMHRADRTRHPDRVPLCTYGTSEGWIHQFNPFVAGSREYQDPRLGPAIRRVVANRDDSIGVIGINCNPRRNRDRMIDGEFDLNYSTGRDQLRATDVCGPKPTLIFAPLVSVPTNPRSPSAILSSPLYPLYVPGHLSDPTPNDRPSLNSVEEAMLFFAAVLHRQCGQLPASVRVVLRSEYTRVGSGPYAYREIFGGHFLLTGELPELIPDDQAEAGRLRAWTRQRHAWTAEQAERKRIANEQGALLLFGALMGLATNGPRCLRLRMDGVCLKRE